MKRLIIIFSFSSLMLLALPAQAVLLNTAKEIEMKDNLSTVTTEAGYNTGATVESTIGNIIKVSMSLLGTIFMVLLVIAGINWMKAEGNEEEIKEAKKTIKSLLIGIIVIIGAFALSNQISRVFANILLSF